MTKKEAMNLVLSKVPEEKKEAFVKAFREAKTVEERFAVAKKYGATLTDEEAQAIKAEVGGEISDEELDCAAGGCCSCGPAGSRAGPPGGSLFCSCQICILFRRRIRGGFPAALLFGHFPDVCPAFSIISFQKNI